MSNWLTSGCAKKTLLVTTKRQLSVELHTTLHRRFVSSRSWHIVLHRPFVQMFYAAWTLDQSFHNRYLLIQFSLIQGVSEKNTH